eukprot:CAMPEP_0201277834 /NCGR_PEP_ID=MMETSP0853-20130426/59775_1 /ASSEMBLY_ACC=CAM_ASM_000640 /TAXON_ID=183588 /ORGANISM="Pseudo-nitzschia fraudulenta, Strain WWA7" /LENGTH=337 /DNA_ID=CAMNT_0047586047 /DNA_START=58 /DNA_END=1071 /DNA_ORIENTATION=-
MGDPDQPRERGFDYVSGVKRQAGQERTTHNARRHHSSLRRLEATAEADTAAIAEREELVSVARRNGIVAGGGRDVSFNAGIRAVFRSDRERKKRTEREAKRLGWREGMFLLDDDDDDDIEREDVLRSKETCYGNAALERAQEIAKSEAVVDICEQHQEETHQEENNKNNDNDNTGASRFGAECAENEPSARAHTNEEGCRKRTHHRNETTTPKQQQQQKAKALLLVGYQSKRNHERKNNSKNDGYTDRRKARRNYSSGKNKNKTIGNSNNAAQQQQQQQKGPAANYSSGKNKNKTIGNSNNAAQQQQQQQKQKHNAMASFLELVAAYGSSDDDGGHE